MARPKRKRKARAERLHREPVVRRVADVLLTGEPTRWRWVSACRHGIRAALCELGYRNGNPTISPWEQADRLAEEIVTAARHRIGLSRLPVSWRETQGEPYTSRVFYYCGSCSGHMPEGSDVPWCSEECRRLIRARHYDRQRDESVIRHVATIAIAR